MVNCTVRYLFTDDPELEGQGFLIGCNRCAGFKIPLLDPVMKKLSFIGNAIKHAEGIPYLLFGGLQCDGIPGTPTKPCFL
jgi:hypothetical protein